MPPSLWTLTSSTAPRNALSTCPQTCLQVMQRWKDLQTTPDCKRQLRSRLKLSHPLKRPQRRSPKWSRSGQALASTRRRHGQIRIGQNFLRSSRQKTLSSQMRRPASNQRGTLFRTRQMISRDRKLRTILKSSCIWTRPQPTDRMPPLQSQRLNQSLNPNPNLHHQSHPLLRQSSKLRCRSRLSKSGVLKKDQKQRKAKQSRRLSLNPRPRPALLQEQQQTRLPIQS